MELFAEFKFNFTADPFIDPEDPLVPDNDFERDSDAARLLRGQIASYVAALSGSQFRVHVFSILICGKFARLMYWDRNGAIVTRAFDYTILDFLSLFLRHYDLAVNSADMIPQSPFPVETLSKKFLGTNWQTTTTVTVNFGSCSFLTVMMRARNQNFLYLIHRNTLAVHRLEGQRGQ
jgi:hypothetical protein